MTDTENTLAKIEALNPMMGLLVTLARKLPPPTAEAVETLGRALRSGDESAPYQMHLLFLGNALQLAADRMPEAEGDVLEKNVLQALKCMQKAVRCYIKSKSAHPAEVYISVATMVLFYRGVAEKDLPLYRTVSSEGPRALPYGRMRKHLLTFLGIFGKHTDTHLKQVIGQYLPNLFPWTTPPRTAEGLSEFFGVPREDIPDILGKIRAELKAE